MGEKLELTIEQNIQIKRMKYFKNNLVIMLLLITSIAVGQDTDVPSKLKDFEGIWQFMPPEWSNDTSFIAIEFLYNSKRMTLFYRKNNKSVHTLGPDIIGFIPKNKAIRRLSDLEEVGQRMYFYRPNPKAPNDSLKYFDEASPSCFASFNGLGTDTHEPPAKGKPNYFLFNFNGREYERHEQISHLPNYIVVSLVKNKSELLKVEAFLNKKYLLIKTVKCYISDSLMNKTKMYLITNDPIEVLEEKEVNKIQWLKVRYYGKTTIEGWIKKSDVE